MWRFFVLILSLIASTASFIPRQHSDSYSAASKAQIRFAIENKYDDTGPGSKEPEYAYQTYKTLEDALVSYLDDPDTKLPEFEKAQALATLQGNEDYNLPIRQIPKTVEEYTGYSIRPNEIPQRVVYDRPNYGYGDVTAALRVPPKKLFTKVQDGISFHKVQAVRPTEAFGSQDLQEAHDQFDPNPKYSFSYGVHDKVTGDSKSAHEVREGGTVRGYYTFLDADGKQRTVHYTADDKLGFRATVQRTQRNTQ